MRERPCAARNPPERHARQLPVDDRGERIPIHGGIGDPLGVFNAIYGHWKAGQGYANVDDGSSFIMAMQFVKGKCPFSRARS